MANLIITQVPLGLRMLTDNVDVTFNEFSVKRNNLATDEIEIISDNKNNYATFKIDFSIYDAVSFDGTVINDVDSLYSTLIKYCQLSNYQVDSNNSTSDVLLGGATFTGSKSEILGYGIIFINVYSDVASATNGLSVQQSSDGVNWDHSDEYTVLAGAGKNYSINPYAKYLRVLYTNGVSDQTEFRLQTILKANSKPSSHRIQDSIVDEDDGELVKAILSAKANGGGYVNITATRSNNLRVSTAEDGLAIAKGEVVGASFIHKFGKAPDFDTGDGFVTVWDGANDAGVNLMQYTYSATADIDRISSDSASDTFDVEIQGLDTNYDSVTQTITLTGLTAAPLDTSLVRVFRMRNVGNADNVGRIFCFKNVTTTLGIPDTLANIRAIIQPGNNQTLMSIYTIPNGYTAYMRDWYVSLNNNVATSLDLELRARPFGQVFQIKHTQTINSTGTSTYKHDYTEPEVFAAKTDITMRVKTAGTSVAASAGFDLVLIAD